MVTFVFNFFIEALQREMLALPSTVKKGCILSVSVIRGGDVSLEARNGLPEEWSSFRLEIAEHMLRTIRREARSLAQLAELRPSHLLIYLGGADGR